MIESFNCKQYVLSDLKGLYPNQILCEILIVSLVYAFLYMYYHRKHPYELYCARFGLSDDTTAAIFIGKYNNEHKSHSQKMY